MSNGQIFRSPVNLMLMYLGILIWLSIGLMVSSGTQYLGFLVLYGTVFVVVFMGVGYLLQRTSRKPVVKYTLSASVFSYLAFVFSLLVVVAQLWAIAKVPVFSAASSADYNEITFIRQFITVDTPGWLNYLTSLDIRAILPLLCIVTLINKNYVLFALSVCISLFFCLALMQKSYIAVVFIPVILFSLFNRKWTIALFQLFLSVAGIILLVLVTNPQIRPQHWNRGTDLSTPNNSTTISPEQGCSSNKITKTACAIIDRTLIIPGAVIADWFSLIPETIPFGEGCGDRFLAKFLGCDHISYPTKVFEHKNPDYVAKGIQGGVNAASFMEGYANFGIPGLIWAAIELGIWLALVSFLLAELGVMTPVINALFILLLSSVSLHTLLLSGGWGLTILLTWFLRSTFKKENDVCVA